MVHFLSSSFTSGPLCFFFSFPLTTTPEAMTNQRVHAHARMVRVRRAEPEFASLSGSSAPSATAIVDSAAPSSGTNSTVNLTVPNVTKTLEVVVAILALIILLGLGLCFYRRWRRKAKKTTAPSHIIDFTHEQSIPYEKENQLDLHASAFILEKPSSVYIPGGSAADMNPGWVPQIPPNGSTKLASSSSTLSKFKGTNKSLRASRGWDKTFSSRQPQDQSRCPRPRPTNRRCLLHPPTPPAKKPKNPFSRNLPPAKQEPVDLPPVPVLSPTRNASFAAHQSMALAAAQMERIAEQSAKLVVVVNPFVPSMDDELPIQVGETLRVLEEYQDGWALVGRIGSPDVEKGVVPQSCLAERTLANSPKLTPNRRV
ncbi:hypothetical protein MKEN_01075600 [Mycena kentingensis (nom. inval.)]|nr:hypothetical protein MKEN_01075600 [Mycena kentingensis (nom. inval.)]